MSFLTWFLHNDLWNVTGGRIQPMVGGFCWWFYDSEHTPQKKANFMDFRDPLLWDGLWFRADKLSPSWKAPVPTGGVFSLGIEPNLSYDLWALVQVYQKLGVNPKIGVVNPPKWMVKIMENPMNKWMIWVFSPYFWKHPTTICNVLGKL